MKLSKLLIATASLFLATSLFAGFDAMNPLQSSSHDTTNPSNNKDVTISWNQATPNSSDVLSGYYYIMDQSSTTLMPNIVDTRNSLASSATSKVETITGSDGSYYFHLAPYAEGGNIGATLHFGPIKIDTTAPGALSISPDGGSFSETKSVSMSATDANNYTIYYTTDNSTPTASNGNKYTTAITVAASKTLKAVAIDSAGNSSNVKSSAFTINSTTNVAQFGNEINAGSTVATNSDGNSASVKRTVSVEGSAVTHYKYKFDTASFSAQTLKATDIDLSTLADGAHTVSIVGYDGSTWQADNSATTLSFTVDNTAPSAISFSTASGTTITANTTITISSVGSTNIYYTLDGSDPTTASTNSSSLALTSSNTDVTLKAIALDDAGNKSAISQAIYTVNIAAASSGGGSTTTTDETTEPVVDEVVDSTVDETVTDTAVDTTVDVTDTEVATSDIDTGLSIGETTSTLNEDGTTTDITSFTSASGEVVEIELLTKLDTASTVTDADGTATTTATAISSLGKVIDIEVKINPNGTVQNSLQIGDDASDVEVAVVGADTTLNADGSMKTVASITAADGTTTSATVEVNADGTLSNALAVTDTAGALVQTQMDTNILGTDTIVASDGALTITTPVVVTDTGDSVAVSVVANAQGLVKPTITLNNSTVSMPEFKAGSKVDVRQENGKVLVEVITTVTEPITFN